MSEELTEQEKMKRNLVAIKDNERLYNIKLRNLISEGWSIDEIAGLFEESPEIISEKLQKAYDSAIKLGPNTMRMIDSYNTMIRQLDELIRKEMSGYKRDINAVLTATRMRAEFLEKIAELEKPAKPKAPGLEKFKGVEQK